MAQVFDGPITLTAATATRLSTALVAAGYTGSMIGKFLDFNSLALADLFHGSSSAVSAVTGRALGAGLSWRREAQSPRLCVDAASVWLFSTGGGALTVTFESF